MGVAMNTRSGMVTGACVRMNGWRAFCVSIIDVGDALGCWVCGQCVFVVGVAVHATIRGTVS